MPDYKSMYLSLFNAVTDAIEALKSAQQKSENTYIETGCDKPDAYPGSGSNGQD